MQTLERKMETNVNAQLCVAYVLVLQGCCQKGVRYRRQPCTARTALF